MLKKIAAAASLVLASSAALAADPGSFYAGLDVGKTKIEHVNDRESSYGLFVGYQFHQNFAFEAGMRRLENFDYGFGNQAGYERTGQVALSVVGSLPLGERLSVFGRLGYNRIGHASSYAGNTYRYHENKPLYGVGLAYALTPTISARVELQKPASYLTNVNAGLAFQF